jgi:general secretion pathway protein L
MNRLGRNINDFFRWWRSELAFLVPDPLKQIFNENKGKIIVEPEANSVRVYFVLGNHKQELGVFELNEIGKAEYLALLEKETRLEKSDLVIRLSDQDAIEKILLLPAAAEDNLEQVISYELDKITPFHPEQVYFAVSVLDEEAQSDQIKVQLVLTPREKLDAICKELKGWGLVPAIADFANHPNDFEHERETYNLLPAWARAQENVFAQAINYGVIGLLLILLAAVLIIPVWKEATAVEQLNEQIKDVAQDAAEVEELRNEIEQLQDKTARLLEKKTNAASMLEMLEVLSKLIPDDTWLKHLRFSKGKLQIQGQSPTASSLISLLEESDLFDSVRFVSPVTQDRRTGLERFQISAEISKGKNNVGSTE